jgi:hypothetical protein
MLGNISLAASRRISRMDNLAGCIRALNILAVGVKVAIDMISV